MFSANNCLARIRFLPVLFGAVFLSLACVSFASAQSGLSIEGKSVDPIKASQGKIAVLIFVRTDCPISNRYAPTLQKLSADFQANAKFWLVYPDKRTTPQQITEHLRQFHYSISALRDPAHSLAKFVSATITPEAAVFSAQGKLLYHGRIDNLYVDAGRARSAATTHELKDAIESAAFGKTRMTAFTPSVGCYISDLE